MSFGEDSHGELYSIDEVTGEVEHVIDASQKPGISTGAKNNFANLNLKLSPNPNKGQFTIELTAPQNQVYSVIITDIIGTPIISETKSATAGINTWSFSSPKLHKGIYMLHVQSLKASITQNFIVDK